MAFAPTPIHIELTDEERSQLERMARGHRNILAEAKTFLRWSMGKGYLRTNPLEGVQGTGKRRHGKPQLRIDEARKWQAKAILLAEEGKDSAVAALVTLVMGLRAGEVVSPDRSRSG